MDRWSGVDKSNCSQEGFIDEVVLVGGSSRVICVREEIRNTLSSKAEGALFGNSDKACLGGCREFCTSINPDRAVSHGKLSLICPYELVIFVDRTSNTRRYFDGC